MPELCDVLGAYVAVQLQQSGNQNGTRLAFDGSAHSGELLVYLDNRRKAGKLVIQQVAIEPTGGNVLLPCLEELGRQYRGLGLACVVIESIFSDEWLAKLEERGLTIRDNNAIMRVL